MIDCNFKRGLRESQGGGGLMDCRFKWVLCEIPGGVVEGLQI